MTVYIYIIYIYIYISVPVYIVLLNALYSTIYVHIKVQYMTTYFSVYNCRYAIPIPAPVIRLPYSIFVGVIYTLGDVV